MCRRYLATLDMMKEGPILPFSNTSHMDANPTKKAETVNHTQNGPEVNPPMLTKEEEKKLYKSQRNDKVHEAGLYQAIHNLRHNRHR
jgi:hypothetical protein